jgi:hypothetical protein
MWDRLRKANERFQLNALELQRHEKAAAALKRIQEILKSKSPYSLIKEADGLIQTVDVINQSRVQQRRDDARAKIEQRRADLQRELDAVGADSDLRTSCMNPMDRLKQQVTQEESLAHIAQAEGEAIRAFDEAMREISEWQAAVKKQSRADRNASAAKPLRVIKPAELATQSYLETDADIEAFLETLRKALKAAVSEHNRIQIR